MTKPNWKDKLGCIGTVYDPDPTLAGYIVMTTAAGTGLDRYNSRMIVNSLSEVESLNDPLLNVDNDLPQTEEAEKITADQLESTCHDSPERDLDEEINFYDAGEDLVNKPVQIDRQAESATIIAESSNTNTRQSLTTNVQSASSAFEQSPPVTTSEINTPPEPRQRRVLPEEPLSSFRIFPVQTNRVLPTASSSSRVLPAQTVTPSKRTLPAHPATPNKRVLPGQSTPTSRRVLPPQTYAANSGPPIQRVINYTLESNKLYEALSDEQKSVYDTIMDGRSNVFFTGSAGTGKSVLLRALISKFRVMYSKDEVAITASTGIAAVNIEGTTIHKFAHIGFGEKQAEEYIKAIRNNRGVITRLNKVRVLIVDEISMLDGRLLDKIEFVCRSIRNNMFKPFGGIRVVFCGDFFQLPPVDKGNAYCPMAFEAECWDKVIDKCFILKKTFRQTDSEFIAILNDIRHGVISEDSERKLKLLSRTPQLEAGIEQTELCSLRSQVDVANRQKLDRLPGEAHRYQASDSADPAYVSELNNMMVPKELVLKEGTQVMLLKNLSATLVNGSIGKVIGFQDRNDDKPFPRKLPIVYFLNGETRVLDREDWKREIRGKTVASRTQIPLMLAWAMSIHKSQGQTIPYAKINLNNVFEIGQVYVALSRATSMDKLQVLNFKASAVKANPKVAQFYRRLEANT